MNSSLLKVKDKNWFYISLLFIIAVIAYWQIAFLKYSVTHDMINCWIPWRYYISNCIENHTFPFWNPYQQLGYPIHADLQGPTWYLESLLLSITVGQNNYTVQLLFIFYVFLAGTGMYLLSLCFQSKKNIAFIIAVSYMLCGFFVAHVQHFYAIIGAAWLPFIILNYYKMHQQKSYIHGLYASIFMFLNLTGGNHTFSIILVYLCLFILWNFIYQAIKEGKKSEIISYIKLNSIFAISTIILATVVIVAFAQTAPYVARLSGMTYSNAAVCPLSPQSLLSLFIPFATVNSQDFFNTDPSMSNIYFGIIILVFIFLSAIAKKTVLEKTLFVFGLICLFASFGNYTPIHKFIFDYVPLMNLFRFPSYFSLFSILLFLLLGGKQLAVISDNFALYKKRILIVCSIFIGFLVLLITYSFTKNNRIDLFFLKSYASIFDFINASSFYQNILLQGSIQVLFLIAFILTITTRLKKYWLRVTSILIIFNLLIAVQLNIASVGFSVASPKELKEYLTTLPKAFPIPDTTKIIENTEALGQKHGLYRNTSGFHKRISADVFNSYSFKNYSILIDSFPVLYKAMLTNELFYFSDCIYPNVFVSKLDSSGITNQTIVLSDGDYLKTRKLISTTKNQENKSSYLIQSFSPNEITLTCNTSKTELLTLLQSNYTGWNATIDNIDTEIYLSNYLTMSILVPLGKHSITFKYTNTPIVIAAAVSYIYFIALLIFLSIYWIKKYNQKRLIACIWVFLFSCITYYFI